MNTENRKSRIARRGVLRFCCGLCVFEVNVSPGVTYAGANQALGMAGWRIEKRSRHGDEAWMPVCNACATPDPSRIPIETTIDGKVL